MTHWPLLRPYLAGSVLRVATKERRKAARECVARYQEARLAELVDHVGDSLDRYRAGEIDAFDVDETIHRYHRAARELWKFCWAGSAADVEVVADTIEHLATCNDAIDWWQRGAPRASR